MYELDPRDDGRQAHVFIFAKPGQFEWSPATTTHEAPDE